MAEEKAFMIRKRKLIVLISLTAFALLLVAYFAIIKPLTAAEETKPPEPLELVDDIEQEGPNSRYLMFPQVERNDVKSIRVTNVYGTYEFCRNSDGEFCVKDHETVAYDLQLFAYLVNSTGYTLAMTKICDNASPETFAQYGLAEPQASWTIVTNAGKSYSVDVGSKLVTGAGFYCRFVGRDSIYILAQSLEYTVLQPIEKLVSPTLISGIDSNDYYMMDNFMILHGDTPFFSTRIKDKDEQNDPDALMEAEVIYPGRYEPSDDVYYGALNTISTLTGTSVVKLGYTEDDLKRYGLFEPAYTIGFKYKDEEIMLFFSEQQEDGTYYALSSLFPDTISVCDGDTVSFLQADVLSWISPYVFRYYITAISEFSIRDSSGETVFTLSHGTDKNGNALLDVSTNKGKNIPNAEVYNFRLFYKVLISIAIKGDAPFTEDEVADKVANEEPYLVFKYKDLSGKTTELAFYRYSTRRSLLTVNGRGQFYVYTDILDKISGDVVRVLNDEEIDSYGKN